jgi:superfamily II DNA helicase RecQ
VAALRTWRTEEARRRQVSPFVILTNRVLLELADRRPANDTALREIHGVGPKLATTYGRMLIMLCAGGRN